MTPRLRKPRLFVRVTDGRAMYADLEYVDERGVWWIYWADLARWGELDSPFTRRHERDLLKTHVEVPL